MGTKKSKLEKDLERSLKLLAEIHDEDEKKNIPNIDSLGERLRQRDGANKPDALAGDEAFEDRDADEERPDDWWD